MSLSLMDEANDQLQTLAAGIEDIQSRIETRFDLVFAHSLH